MTKVELNLTSNNSKTKAELQILITQPRPESDKSPYFELERKYHVNIDFVPFIEIQPITAKEFRKQKIEIFNHTAVVLTSRNAIDHFFRMCEELKVNVGQDTKYFCINEAVALYLQKFILYRKRKVFFGAMGTNKSMFEAISKHKENEKFIYPCSENQQDGEIVSFLKTNKCDFATAFMYRSVSSDVKNILAKKTYDIMCFFTPSGVRSLFDNMPEFKQDGALVGTWGANTLKVAEELGITAAIKAPQPNVPSMVDALAKYLAENLKKVPKV
jgi:uroporphyrinogen-III synthase